MIEAPLVLNEKELLIRLRAGDKNAFEQLYHTYKERLAANLFNLLKSWDEVEEKLQELFVRIWENRQQIDTEKPFQAYLYRIAINLVNDYFRNLAKDKKLADQLWMHLSELYEPDFLLAQIKTDEELMRIIEQLPPQRKNVFKLCKLEGKTYAEVSRMLCISQAAVNDHITKANKFLYENFNKSIPLLVLLLCQQLTKGV